MNKVRFAEQAGSLLAELVDQGFPDVAVQAQSEPKGIQPPMITAQITQDEDELFAMTVQGWADNHDEFYLHRVRIGHSRSLAEFRIRGYKFPEEVLDETQPMPAVQE